MSKPDGKKVSCLEEAQKIVYGRGEKEYGHPLKNFAHTARLLNAHFYDKLKHPFTPQDVAYILILVKLSRQNNMEKRDNIVDIAGYAETAQRVIDRMDETGGMDDAFCEGRSQLVSGE